MNFPYLPDAMWFLTQQRRWGLPDDDPDYLAVARAVNRIGIYRAAAERRRHPPAGQSSAQQCPFDGCAGMAATRKTTPAHSGAGVQIPGLIQFSPKSFAMKAICRKMKCPSLAGLLATPLRGGRRRGSWWPPRPPLPKTPEKPDVKFGFTVDRHGVLAVAYEKGYLKKVCSPPEAQAN